MIVAVALAGCGAHAARDHRAATVSPTARAANPPRPLPANATLVTVSGTPFGRPIPSGFVGLSLEYQAIEPYAGSDPKAIDPVLVQLIRNLSPGQTPVLRIGGDSTDWTWWPVPGSPQPPGVSITIGPNWARVAHALIQQLGARTILGIDLEADSATLASVEARGLVAGIGSASVRAFELGNEPELYPSFKWGRSGATGRPRGYDFTAFTHDFARIGGALPRFPLAGPTTGALTWMKHLDQFLAAERRLGLVTLHRYPLQQCYISLSSPQYPTIGNLLSKGATTGLASSVTPYVALSHGRGLPVRIDEMNTVSCGSGAGVSNAFASALWALDALFEMARVSVDGVNIHTYPGATYELFTFRHEHGSWVAAVAPEYYGLLAFAQGAPPGSRLLRTTVARGGGIRAWATRGLDGRTRVVLINVGSGRPRTVAVRAPAGTATLERLQAPDLHATRGVTLGGRSFGSATTTGLLAGSARSASITSAGNQYTVTVPAGSAVLLTVPAG